MLYVVFVIFINMACLYAVQHKTSERFCQMVAEIGYEVSQNVVTHMEEKLDAELLKLRSLRREGIILDKGEEELRELFQKEQSYHRPSPLLLLQHHESCRQDCSILFTFVMDRGILTFSPSVSKLYADLRNNPNPVPLAAFQFTALWLAAEPGGQQSSEVFVGMPRPDLYNMLMTSPLCVFLNHEPQSMLFNATTSVRFTALKKEVTEKWLFTNMLDILKIIRTP